MTHLGLYLSPTHPLAQVAASHCAEHFAPLVGGVACGACWERTIRDDERFVVLGDLDDEPPVEPDDLVDDIAVERACAGERLPLNEAETAAAIRKLRAAGWSKNAITDQLEIAERIVNELAPPIPREQVRVKRRRAGVAA